MHSLTPFVLTARSTTRESSPTRIHYGADTDIAGQDGTIGRGGKGRRVSGVDEGGGQAEGREGDPPTRRHCQPRCQCWFGHAGGLDHGPREEDEGVRDVWCIPCGGRHREENGLSLGGQAAPGIRQDSPSHRGFPEEKGRGPRQEEEQFGRRPMGKRRCKRKREGQGG